MSASSNLFFYMCRRGLKMDLIMSYFSGKRYLNEYAFIAAF